MKVAIESCPQMFLRGRFILRAERCRVDASYWKVLEASQRYLFGASLDMCTGSWDICTTTLSCDYINFKIKIYFFSKANVVDQRGHVICSLLFAMQIISIWWCLTVRSNWCWRSISAFRNILCFLFEVPKSPWAIRINAERTEYPNSYSQTCEHSSLELTSDVSRSNT